MELALKKIVLVAFDQFTDIDLFLMWDILGRNTEDWHVRILGSSAIVRSAHDVDKRRATLLPVLPVGQQELYDALIGFSIRQALTGRQGALYDKPSQQETRHGMSSNW